MTGGTLASGSASQIQYGSHLEDVTRAGFTINQITPSNPDKRVDITIKAFNNTGNEQGWKPNGRGISPEDDHLREKVAAIAAWRDRQWSRGVRGTVADGSGRARDR